MLEECTIGGLHQSLMNKLPPLELDTPILDIGCGTGAWLERLSHLGFSNLHGIDCDQTHFKFPQALFTRLNLDETELDLEREFQFISAIEVIEHLEAPGKLFCSVSKRLSEGGFFLFTTPNIHSLYSRFKFFVTGRLPHFDQYGDPTHLFPILLHTLDRMLIRNKLEIVQKWTFPERNLLGINLRQSSKLVLSILSLMTFDPFPGDILCVLTRKNSNFS